jgi:hypothetical protein
VANHSSPKDLLIGEVTMHFEGSTASTSVHNRRWRPKCGCQIIPKRPSAVRDVPQPEIEEVGIGQPEPALPRRPLLRCPRKIVSTPIIELRSGHWQIGENYGDTGGIFAYFEVSDPALMQVADEINVNLANLGYVAEPSAQVCTEISVR